MELKKYIYCAIDFKALTDAEQLISKIKNHIGGIKIGLEFFLSNGPEGVIALKKYNLPIFLDLKFHDIPNTVYQAILSSLSLEPDLLSVHISGGREMLKKITSIKDKKTKILGITMLTSLNELDLEIFGIKNSPQEYVNNLARIAFENKLDGIVCSPNEVKQLKNIFPKNFLFVTPGIRLKNINDDQKRTLSPGEAVKYGSNILIIGRPITKSNNPVNTIKEIINDIEIINDK